MHLFSSSKAQPISPRLKKAGLFLLLFLCVFIPFRTPLSDLTFSGVKALPDVLICALAIWYAISVRFQFQWKLPDVLFLAFEAVALFSTLINGIPVAKWIYETRSIGLYYILYFVLRNFNFGKKELTLMTRTLQGVSLPLFALALVEKISCKTLLFSAGALANINISTNFSRVYSMFYNPNTYGLFLTFVILLSLWISLKLQEKTPLWMYMLLGAALYFTMSRSSMLILGAGLLVLFLCALREKKVQWKRMGLQLAIIAAGVLVLFEGASWAASKYYTAKAQYKLTDKVMEGYSEAQYIVEVPYVTPDGVEHIGYAYHDITYIDKECTTTLNEYGSIVYSTGNRGTTAYILTKNGGMKLDDFQQLSQDEQTELITGSGQRRDENRTSQILDAAKDSMSISAGDRFSELNDSNMYTADFNGRFYSLMMAWKVIEDYPILGTGFGTFGSSASLTWTPPTYGTYVLRENFYADNQYACVMAETGLLGLLLFLSFLFCTLFAQRKSLLKVMACVIIGWFGLFYNILEVQIGAFLLWSILSMQTEPAPEENEENAPCGEEQAAEAATPSGSIAPKTEGSAS